MENEFALKDDMNEYKNYRLEREMGDDPIHEEEVVVSAPLPTSRSQSSINHRNAKVDQEVSPDVNANKEKIKLPKIVSTAKSHRGLYQTMYQHSDA